MLALSYWQPWASLIVLGVKIYDTRGWSTSRRGVHAVHAANKVIPFEEAFGNLTTFLQDKISREIERAYGSYENMPAGAFVGTAEITDVIETKSIRGKLTELDLALGDFSDGRFAWRMSFPAAFSKPVHAKGRQGFWNCNSPHLEEACFMIGLHYGK